MKHIVAAILSAMLMITIVAGCDSPTHVQSLAEPAKMSNEELYTTYLEPLYRAGILDETWFTSGTLSSSLMLDYYKEVKLYPQHTEGSFVERVDEKEVEDFVVASFADYNPRLLRNSNSYEKPNNLYVMQGYRVPRTLSCRAVGVENSGDDVTFLYEVYDSEGDGTPTKAGKLAAQFEEGSYVFTSCEVRSTAVRQLDIHEQIDELWSQLDDYRLPQVEGYPDYRQQVDTFEGEHYPLQVKYPDDRTAYMLAEHIDKYLGYMGNRTKDFDEPQTRILDSGIVSAILFNLAPITDAPVNHLVTEAIRQFRRDGRSVSELYQYADVEDAVRYFYGDQVTEVYHRDTDDGVYTALASGRIYVREGDFGGPWYSYPLIESYQATDRGFICDVMETSAFDRNTPPKGHVGNVDITAENYTEATKNEALYRYTFERAEDGRLVLVSLVTIREATTK